MKCAQCGKELSDNCIYCPFCGVRLPSELTEEKTADIHPSGNVGPSDGTPPPMTEFTYGDRFNQYKRRKDNDFRQRGIANEKTVSSGRRAKGNKKKGVIIAVITTAVVLLLAGAVLASVFLFDSTEPLVASPTSSPEQTVRDAVSALNRNDSAALLQCMRPDLRAQTEAAFREGTKGISLLFGDKSSDSATLMNKTLQYAKLLAGVSTIDVKNLSAEQSSEKEKTVLTGDLYFDTINKGKVKFILDRMDGKWYLSKTDFSDVKDDSLLGKLLFGRSSGNEKS